MPRSKKVYQKRYYNEKEEVLKLHLKFHQLLISKICLLGLSACFAQAPGSPEITSQEELAKTELRHLTEYEQNTINVFQETVQSVVNVSNIKLARMGWFDMQTLEIPRGAGSGFVWDDQGHIVTNYHVIMDGDNFLISFHGDQNQYRAKLVGGEPRQDIAVLKLEDPPENLKPVTLGKTDNLFIGQKAMAIGNPFGLDHTITSGIISAVDRQVPGLGDVTIRGMIQTDAPINPGNSGGPLLDSRGRVIGMNTVIFSRSGQSAGVGFAVPADSISRIVPQIIEHGKVVRPGLGVGILPRHHHARFGVDNGIVLTAVDSESPAYRAGLRGMTRDARGGYRLGDIILKINETEVNSFDDIYHALSRYEVGDKVKVIYRRGSEKRTRTVEVELTAI